MLFGASAEHLACGEGIGSEFPSNCVMEFFAEFKYVRIHLALVSGILMDSVVSIFFIDHHKLHWLKTEKEICAS